MIAATKLVLATITGTFIRIEFIFTIISFAK